MRIQKFFTCIVACLACTSLQGFAAELNQTLSIQGVQFKVQATDQGNLNSLTIKPSGLKNNRPITRPFNGSATEAEVADLNQNGSPEIFVYINASGYASLIGYIAEQKKSLLPIYLPALVEDREASDGYRGHDEFSVVESRLARRFPVYRPGDSNEEPTGGSRLIYYTLTRTEKGWSLLIDEIVNFTPDDMAESESTAS